MTQAQQQHLILTGQLIPISKAAQGTPYSAEYLSLLARKGSLKAIKISRDWLTTKEIVFRYIKKQQQKHRAKLQLLDKALQRSGYET